jgi:histidinol phosphatase-like PHP family hydrolase
MKSEWEVLKPQVALSCHGLWKQMNHYSRRQEIWPYDLHVHSDFSDGRSSVAANVRTAAMCGIQVLAITDHYIDKTFPLGEKLNEYFAAIDEARSLYPEVKVLKGVEGTVYAGGKISIPEEIIDRFELVVIDFGWSGYGVPGERVAVDKVLFLRQVMNCFVALCEDPKVNIAGHPFNFGRLLKGFKFSDLSSRYLNEIAACFAENGTVFEIMNTIHYWFPDMDRATILREYARILRIFDAAGVKFVLSSDAHNHQAIGGISFSSLLLKEVINGS